MPLDLSMTKLLVLGLIALVIFGPDKLPQVARDAGRMVRQLKAMAQQARSDLKSELGDTVGDFDFDDLNPRTFVRKHLLDDSPPATAAPAAAANSAANSRTNASAALPAQAIAAAGVAAVAQSATDPEFDPPLDHVTADSATGPAPMQTFVEPRELSRFDADAT